MPALKTKDIPEHQAKITMKRANAQARQVTRDVFDGKRFNALTPAEKDALLLTMAKMLGIYPDDEAA